MPLAGTSHGPEVVEAFVWGLLPDNEMILERWARRFQVSARNPCALLAHVGEDCPGAVQILPPDRMDDILQPGPLQAEWLHDADIEARLRLLRADHAAWRTASDTGHFSLAGAQSKTAFLLNEGRWGVPFGRTPTTHIFKPPTGGFEGHAENEHFCLSLAREVGLPAASSEVMTFGAEVAIVVERYDRVFTARLASEARIRSAELASAAVRAVDVAEAERISSSAAREARRADALDAMKRDQPILRLHQEDLAQALGLHPTVKYQSDGGPGPEAIIALLRDHSSLPDQDVTTFTNALVFNWLIGGTDGHAKNYSLMHSPGGRVRLAPLYDLASALPYDAVPFQKLKLAMKIGGEYRLRDIDMRRWCKFAASNSFDEEETLARVVAMSAEVHRGAELVRTRCHERGLTHPIIDRLAKDLMDRAALCLRLLRER